MSFVFIIESLSLEIGLIAAPAQVTLRRGDAFPGVTVPVVATGSLSRAPGAYPMRWGIPHPGRDLLVFNSRSETAPDKPMFCTSISERRCLVPASSFYEWKKESGKKVRYRYRGSDGKLLYLGGLYVRSSKDPLPCFSILTRTADANVSDIHGRMPLIIPEDGIGDWLSSAVSYADLLAGPFVPVEAERG